MITNTKFPPNNIAFADMPLSINYVRKGVFTTKGTFARNRFCILPAHLPMIGQSFNFTYQGTTISFSFTLFIPPFSPDNTTLLPTALPGEALIDYCNRLARAFNENQQFANNYECSFLVINATGYGVFEIVAKERGSDFNFSLNGGAYIPDINGNVPIVGTGINPVKINTLRLRAQTTTTKHIFQESTQTEIDLSADGDLDYEANTARFTFNEFQKTATPEIELPHSAFNPFIQHGGISAVNAEIFEVLDGEQKRSITQQEMLVIGGGVPLDVQRTDNVSIFCTQEGQRFLTQMPIEKVISVSQPEWLSFLMTDKTYTTTAVFTVYYSNGTTSTKNVVVANNRAPVMWTIPTGYVNAELQVLENGRKAAYYTIQLTLVNSSITKKSELRTYILDYGYAENIRYYIVQNSLNGWDTFRAIGNADYSAKYERNSYALAMTENSRSQEGTIRASYSAETSEVTVRTAWISSKEELDIWRQLLLSDNVYEFSDLIPNGGTVGSPKPYRQPFKAIIVQGDSFKFSNEDDNEYSLEWKMNYANQEIFYGNTKDYKPAAEPYFDAEISQLISINSVMTGTGIAFSIYANYAEIWVNGVAVARGANPTYTIAPTYGIAYNVVIKAFNLRMLICDHHSHNAVHTITRIKGADLLQLRLLNVREIDISYLATRVASLYSIAYLYLQTKTTGDWGAERNEQILLALKKLKDSGRSIGFNTYSANSTGGGSALGAALKTYLQTNGWTINA